MMLTSTQNPLLQSVRRAVQGGRPLDNGLLAAEGPHLLGEALRSRWAIEHIFFSGEGSERSRPLLGAAAEQGIVQSEVSVRAFKAISDVEQNQGILFLVRPRTYKWPELAASAGPVVILDGIQDPGNAGAIIRSAVAFAGAGVVFTEGSVRISSGKLLRASAGSLFSMPYLENVRRSEVADWFRSEKRALFSLGTTGGAALFDVSFSGPFGLVVGSEGNGISQILQNASQTIRIPTEGVESLNAAIASSIALFEAARQRALRKR